MSSPNVKQMQIANKKVSLAYRLVQLYENPEIEPVPGFKVTMSAAQIATLKQDFVAARTAAIDALNAVTG